MSANKKRIFQIILSVISFLLFWSLSEAGYLIGTKFGLDQMYYNFGKPIDLYPVLFALVSVFTGYFTGFIGLIVVLLILHQLGRRLKWPVSAPTRWGFFLYLLTVLYQILLDNLAAR